MQTTTSATVANQSSGKIFWPFLWQVVRVIFGSLIIAGLGIFWSLALSWLIKPDNVFFWKAVNALIIPGCVFALACAVLLIVFYWYETKLSVSNFTERLRTIPIFGYAYWLTLIAPLIVWAFWRWIIPLAFWALRPVVGIVSKSTIFWRGRYRP